MHLALNMLHVLYNPFDLASFIHAEEVNLHPWINGLIRLLRTSSSCLYMFYAKICYNPFQHSSSAVSNILSNTHFCLEAVGMSESHLKHCIRWEWWTEEIRKVGLTSYTCCDSYILTTRTSDKCSDKYNFQLVKGSSKVIIPDFWRKSTIDELQRCRTKFQI